MKRVTRGNNRAQGVVAKEAGIGPQVSEKSAKASRNIIVPMTLLTCILLSYWFFAPSLFADVMEKGDPTSINSVGRDQLVTSETNSPPLSHPNCQIIYVVGVEGSMHHGATYVIRRFAEQQSDSEGKGYIVHSRSGVFRRGVQWNWGQGAETVSEDVRRNVMASLCPSDGRHHVIIEDTSFPSGFAMPLEGKNASEIVSSLKEDPHPVDLKEFARNFAPLADVRFILLHRPYVNTVASHKDWHGGTYGNAEVLLGFLLYLGELFEGMEEGRRTAGSAPWTVMCVDQFRESRNNKDGNATTAPRERVLTDLSRFLHWHQPDCPTCFNKWQESKKDPEETVGHEAFKMLLNKREKLRGIWPPVLTGDGIPEKQDCPL